MPRFLHTADWQIGRLYNTLLSSNAALLAEARFTTVERLAALAQQHEVAAVLVAGDVFDAQGVADRSIRRLFNALEGYAGPWLLIPGNHDAALAESVWSRAKRLGAVPPNVQLLLSPEPYVDAERGFVALPAPLTQRHTYGDLTDWFDAAETPAGLLRIGLAHGSVQGILAEEIDATNPIAPDRAARARLDYLALGDWHGCKRINARTWYAGTPEPDRFKENGSGQALLVDLLGPGEEPLVKPLAVGQYRWRSLEASLQVNTDLDALLAQLEQLSAADVVALSLQGRIDLPGEQRLADALSRAEGRARHLQLERSGLQLLPTDEDIASLQADGYLGEVMAELRAAQAGEGEEAQTAREALAILSSALLRRAAAGSAMVTSTATRISSNTATS